MIEGIKQIPEWLTYYNTIISCIKKDIDINEKIEYSVEFIKNTVSEVYKIYDNNDILGKQCIDVYWCKVLHLLFNHDEEYDDNPEIMECFFCDNTIELEEFIKNTLIEFKEKITTEIIKSALNIWYNDKYKKYVKIPCCRCHKIFKLINKYNLTYNSFKLLYLQSEPEKYLQYLADNGNLDKIIDE